MTDSSKYWQLAQNLCDTLGASCVFVDEPMSKHTSFRIGGPAAVYVRPSSVQAIADTLRLCAAVDIPVRFLGQGSNVLVSDVGLRCVVVEIGAALSDISIEGTRVVAQAGATNAQLAEAACAAGLSGYEFASGIPGSLGGAAIMNAGAYGSEFRDVATGVSCVMKDGSLRHFSAAEAGWGYRRSVFDGLGCAVVAVELQLRPDAPAAIRARMDDLRVRRESKQPLDMPSAGSTFKRPKGYYVGKLVQEAGLRGYRVGGAQVSEKHTGFVVNCGSATAQDVRSVVADVQRMVQEHSGVALEPELRMWGFE